MQIGRKIYYEKLTGNIVLETGERMGDVIETTAEQDFELYTALQQYVSEQVGVIQLAYGQDSNKFGLYNYSIDTVNNQIVWGGLIVPDAPVSEPTITEQIAELKEQNLILMDAIATLYETMAGGTL